MSQLATVPRLQTAKALQKAKHIRKVKAAIKWHERARKQRQALMQERYESKQTHIARNRWVRENITNVRKEALQNAKEDWKLGPLRPNRAIGEDADKYGAMPPKAMRMPEFPVRVQKNRNEVREKKGQALGYPLVVDDEKYFPIVEGDRVVVLKGREKNKIGEVLDVLEETHEIIIKGLNKHYADSRAWNTPADEEAPPMREVEMPVPFSDVRLVIPEARELRPKGPRPHPSRYGDVIVDEIHMERHDTGIDPFTGVDYGNAPIPPEHRYDPQSGLPLFHRYIAGTRYRIEWPWERPEHTHDLAKGSIPDQDGSSKLREKLWHLRHPFKSFAQRKTRKEKAAKPKKEKKERTTPEVRSIENTENKHSRKPPAPKRVNVPPDAEGTDTTRNIVETGEDLVYRLAYPEYPPSLVDELRPHLRTYARELKKSAKDDPTLAQVLSEKQTNTTVKAAIVEDRIKELIRDKTAIESMKTPMQLRWEQEHAKKVAEAQAKPQISTDALLLALGQHMEKNGVKLTGQRRKAAHNVEELD